MKYHGKNWLVAGIGLLCLVMVPATGWSQGSAPKRGSSPVPPKILQSDSPLRIASDRMEKRSGPFFLRATWWSSRTI